MIQVITIAALLCVAVTFGLALAHALELPGKMRLDRNTYGAVQAIYYPGFTYGGLVGELGGIVLLAAALLPLPYGTDRFWWTAAALALLVAVHAAYWLFTHPVNDFWVRDVATTSAASRFFAAGSRAEGDWRAMRDRWERSHVLRAVLAGASLLALAVGLTGP
ncbi:DUF1772 domain-containing protein [Aquibium sp. A9E412]|uniref:DUF1772 domain-containing protein n=1 Tax=Aquibium sp. A9E412 TaxID=2976767 RepID=UPI0025B017D7|nr:DUF1772 domain-containing protein [Aquibium sp. A9E412]MDN2565790.1 DUF1772 domain-containing protein [Aquibium sp. A9E412]